MFLKGWASFMLLDPQDAVGPSISSSIVLCSFVLLVYIVVLVLVVCLCPSSVHAVANFSGTVLFPLLCSVLPFFFFLLNTLILFFICLNWAQSAKGAHPYRKACRSRGIKVAAPPLDSPCDGPVTYPGDTKILVKSTKGKSGPTLNTTKCFKNKIIIS